jgi:hypothetical protein
VCCAARCAVQPIAHIQRRASVAQCVVQHIALYDTSLLHARSEWGEAELCVCVCMCVCVRERERERELAC